MRAATLVLILFFNSNIFQRILMRDL